LSIQLRQVLAYFSQVLCAAADQVFGVGNLLLEARSGLFQIGTALFRKVFAGVSHEVIVTFFPSSWGFLGANDRIDQHENTTVHPADDVRHGDTALHSLELVCLARGTGT
jgi:hypothetical protein